MGITLLSWWVITLSHTCGCLPLWVSCSTPRTSAPQKVYLSLPLIWRPTLSLPPHCTWRGAPPTFGTQRHVGPTHGQTAPPLVTLFPPASNFHSVISPTSSPPGPAVVNHLGPSPHPGWCDHFGRPLFSSLHDALSPGDPSSSRVAPPCLDTAGSPLLCALLARNFCRTFYLVPTFPFVFATRFVPPFSSLTHRLVPPTGHLYRLHTRPLGFPWGPHLWATLLRAAHDLFFPPFPRAHPFRRPGSIIPFSPRPPHPSLFWPPFPPAGWALLPPVVPPSSPLSLGPTHYAFSHWTSTHLGLYHPSRTTRS